MRDQMSSFDIARMVLDIDALAGARCRKVYQPHYEQVVLRLNPKGMSNRDLVIVRGQRVYFSQRDRPMPLHPPQFAMLLRKHLNNARLTGASHFPAVFLEATEDVDVVMEDVVGGEVVVFVVFNSRGEAVTLGLNQGKFEVTRQTDTGLATVRNPFHGLAKRDDPRAVVKRALGKAKPLTLAELKRRVRRAAK